jgi:D-glycero-D-manno-heptose 1,7-bisphosphate phosphatase
MKMERSPAVFIDRDGTINIEAGYIDHPDNFNLYPFVPQSIRLLNEHGFLVIVLTNQAGVGRGYFGEDNVETLHAKMRSELAKGGARLDAVYYCPHHTSSKDPRYAVDCDCRKPRTGMVDKAVKDLPIDKSRMFIIGDKMSDIKLGKKTGCRTYLVKTGYGLREAENNPDGADIITDNLLLAVLDILKISRQEQQGQTPA